MAQADVPDATESDLLLLLYGGLLQTPMWQGFLEKLRTLTGADHCAIHFRRGDALATEAAVISAGSPRSPQMRELYAGLIHRLDPVPYYTLQPGKPYPLAAFMQPDNPDHEAYRTRYLIPVGMNFKRIMRIVGDDAYNAWITIWSARRDFGPDTDTMLANVAPHISIALRTYQRIEHSHMRARITDEAVRRLNFGWLTLDAAGDIVDIDPAAARLLEGCVDGAADAGIPLRLIGGAARRKLSQALREFASDPGARPRTIRFEDDSGLDMLLLPMRDKALSGARTPVTIAYVHGDSGPHQRRVDQLMELFALTRSEARLALNLTRGRTIVETATDLNLTVETARIYSKRVYSKTGTRGQVDLVRLVLASVVALI